MFDHMTPQLIYTINQYTNEHIPIDFFRYLMEKEVQGTTARHDTLVVGKKSNNLSIPGLSYEMIPSVTIDVLEMDSFSSNNAAKAICYFQH